MKWRALQGVVIGIVALLCTACPRADAPDQADTARVEVPPGAQMPPLEAPGDTSPPAPVIPVDTMVAPDRPPASRPPADPGPPPRPTPTLPVDDALRGTVAVVGAAPMTSVVIRREGAGDVTLHGDGGVMRSLRSVQGLEIEVFGHRQAEHVLHVERFAVRAANGVPAIDGTLQRDGDAWILVSADGQRRRIAHLPAALETRAGQRVWLAGPLDRPPESFGVIE